MKSVLALVMFCSIQSFAQAQNEINRRNFLSLNSDANEITMTVHYPGGSKITEMCGLQLRTNIAGFANNHMEAFLKEVQFVDEQGKEMVPVQRLSEPPFIMLESVEAMSITYKLRTKSGKSLRTVIREAAESEKLNLEREPEIVVVARHCKDNS